MGFYYFFVDFNFWWFEVTYESAAQRSASKTAAAILSGKFNKKFKEGTNVDDFIEVRYFA